MATTPAKNNRCMAAAANFFSISCPKAADDRAVASVFDHPHALAAALDPA
jgi:hypothetical protein